MVMRFRSITRGALDTVDALLAVLTGARGLYQPLIRFSTLPLHPERPFRPPQHVPRPQAEQRFGGALDILVNNVGRSIRKASTFEYTAEEFAVIIETNFNTVLLLTQVCYTGAFTLLKTKE